MPVISNFGVPVDGNDGTTLMPKLQYRFRVIFNGIGKAGNAKKELTQNVISVSVKHTNEEVIVDPITQNLKLVSTHGNQ